MAELLKVQKENSRYNPVTDRAAQMDDEVTLDFEGSVDGVPFEGGKAENYKLVLGSHSFIDTFEDQLVGKNIGEDVEVNVTFPEDYQAEELAGKPAVFKCKINSITESQLPELNDEFASEVSDFETLDEYKADLKAKALERKEKEAKTAKQNALVDKAVENASMEIADAMITSQARNMANDFAQRLQMQGMTVDQYLQYTGLTREALVDQMKPQAETRIKNRLVLEAIAKAENIEVSDEEVEAEMQKMADAYKMELDKVKEYLGEAGKDSLKDDLAVQKAVDLIVDSAK